ncbi:MAG: hypothetical protein PHD85_01745 [Bacilli bacterium]|nr:hypothetical protein [Bacilli bacterium]
MRKQQSIVSWMLGCYVLIQLIAYILSVFIGISGKNYIINYASIVFNFLMGLLLFIFLKKNDSLIVLIALVFTLVADTGLIILEDVETISVFFFIFVQLCYAIRIRQFSLKLPLKFDIIVRFGLVIMFEVIALVVLKENFNGLVLVALLYFVNFVINLFFTLMNIKQTILFALGLLLFILCDISLGLRMLGDFIDVSNNSFIQAITTAPIDLVWMFYFPSQVLIVLSMKYNRMVNE